VVDVCQNADVPNAIRDLLKFIHFFNPREALFLGFGSNIF